MDFSALLIKMFVFAVLLTVGYGMSRKGFLSREFIKGASTLLLNVFITASIINSVLGARPQMDTRQLLRTLLILTLLEVAIYVFAWICSIPARKQGRGNQPELIMAITNSLFIGLPVVQAISGSEAVFYVGLSCIPFNLILYTYGVWRFCQGKGESKLSLRDIVSIPLIASAVSLLIFILNPPVPRLLQDLFSTVGTGTVPLSMIIIGANLGKTNPVKAFGDGKLWLISLERLIICPVILFFVMRLFTDNLPLLLSCTVLAGCPVGTIITPLSIQYGHDAEYASESVMVSTILCMFTLPLLLKILF